MDKRADATTVLVEDLQRLPFHHDGWERFATRLGETLHGPVILGTVSIPDAVPVRTQYVLIDDGAMARYRRYYYGLSPWLGWTQTAEQGAVAGGKAINPLPPELYENTEFYADFLRPNGMHHGLSARIARDDKFATDLAVLRPPQNGPMSARELGLLRYLMPRVRRALRVRQLLGGTEISPVGLLRAEVGVVLAGRDARVLFANGVAHQRLADADGLAIGRGGVLTATHLAAQPRLRSLLRLAVDGAGPFLHRGGGDMLLPRPGQPPLRVTIVPTPPDGSTHGQLLPAALLLLREPPAGA